MPEKIQRGPDEKGKFVTQDVNATVTIRDDDTYATKSYALTGLETENTKFGKVDIATATVVPTENDYYTPEFEDTVKITINGENVYSGYVGEVKPKENATFELKCFNDVRKLKSTSVNVGTEEEFVLATSILKNTILPKAGIWNYEVDMGAGGLTSVDRKQIKNNTPEDVPVQFEATQASATSIIERLAKYTNSVWWIDGSGTFHFGEPKTEVYELSYVKEASAGKTTPPYRSVKVIGGGEASQASWGLAHQIAKDPITATRTLENVFLAKKREQIKQEEGDDFDAQEDLTQDQLDAYKVKKGYTTPPVYKYKDKSIKTQEQADAIANAVADKLVQQTRQGWVKIVGWAGITPFDVIEMPDFLGGEQYFVQGVEHTLDNSNGFETRIQCGGLVHTGDEYEVEGAYNG